MGIKRKSKEQLNQETIFIQSCPIDKELADELLALTKALGMKTAEIIRKQPGNCSVVADEFNFTKDGKKP